MIYENLLKILSDCYVVDISKIDSETRIEDLKLDSLDKIDILVKIEEDYHVELELNDNITIGELVALINSRCATS